MYKITVRGIVQGVGFRPFVYRLAKSMGLRGYVKNTGTGCVEIVIDKNVDEFIKRLKNELPPIAEISEVVVEPFNEQFKDEDFYILRSGGKRGKLSLPPPDIAVCDECLKEVFDYKNRRYLYPFTSCTNCGPRFSVALKLPYDRENTSFCEFPMCEDCLKEYKSVEDRRYYAQTVACPKCGPNYKLVKDKIIAEKLDAIKLAAKFIDKGKIVAIKGIGGYHIACKAEDENVVLNLRERLSRPQQPFAVMVRDLNVLERIAYLNVEEKKALESYIRPILVLKSKNKLVPALAPMLNTVGVMLPYTPLHNILFSFLDSDVLVMTSANLPGEPMFIDENIFDSNLADYYLTHNLKIANRIDDSVIKFVGKRRMIIRKSRGLVPDKIKIDTNIEAVSVGAELYNSLSILKDGCIIQSQYIGNTSNFKTYKDFFSKAFRFWLEFTKLKPNVVFCDLHPLYNTTKFAENYCKENEIKLVKVQHHFSHAMSVMAEKNLNRAVAIAVDGAGYGFDGNIWGCEILYLDFDEKVFERIGRMEYLPLPGGDNATNNPGRILYAILHEKNELNVKFDWEKMNIKPELISFQLEKNLNIARASSAGRYLDVCSVLLGIYSKRTYEGEGAMKLEAFAVNGNLNEAEKWLKDYPVNITSNIEVARYTSPFDDFKGKKKKVKIINIGDVLVGAIKENNLDKKDLALALTLYLSKSISELAIEEAIKKDACIIMSGGVAYNTIITPYIENSAKKENIKFYVNEITAAGDNGISVGQLYSSLLL